MQLVNSFDFFRPVNFPDVWNEMDKDDIARCANLQGQHPFFNATNFKVPNTVIQLLKDIGLTMYVEGSFLFNIKQMYDGPIHTDGFPPDYQRLVGLNWTWFGENTSMHWYKQVGEPKFLPYRNINVPVFDSSNTEEVFSSELLGCNLVNIKDPHQVKSRSDKMRFTLSISFEGNPSWDEATELFQDYFRDRRRD